MKIAAKDLFDKYFEIFKIDFRYFFHNFKENSPCIIYAILMNANLRDMLLKELELKEILTKLYTLTSLNIAKSLIYSKFEIFSKTDSPLYDEANSISEVTIQKLSCIFCRIQPTLPAPVPSCLCSFCTHPVATIHI
jgi:hypothetical protein